MITLNLEVGRLLKCLKIFSDPSGWDVEPFSADCPITQFTAPNTAPTGGSESAVCNM